MKMRANADGATVALGDGEIRDSQLQAFEDLLDAMDDGVALFDQSLRFLICNRRYLELLFPAGHPRPTRGTRSTEVIRDFALSGKIKLPHGMDVDAFVAQRIEWARRFGDPTELETIDGRTLLSTSKRTELGSFMITLRDITGEKQSGKIALNMLHDAFETIEDGLVLCDKEMRYVLSNEAWKRAIYGRHPELLPKAGDLVLDKVNELVKEQVYKIPNGMTDKEYVDWMMQEMAEHGKKVRIEFANGRTAIGSSHLTAFGGALLILRDITDQLQTETELQEQREIAHQNEKLSAMGELLAGVAHELNNPLSVVSGYAQMLQGKIDDPLINERLDMIRQSSERAGKIVRTFLAMARQRPARIEHCNVNAILQTSMEISANPLRANGTKISTSLGAGIPSVSGDFDQLAQVFSNLLVNAGHAVAPLKSAGEISIRSSFDPKSSTVLVEVEDNGSGIEEALQKRVFEPFFTTKDVNEGTGIGLAFSHRIVQSHMGELTLSSTTGVGSIFYVRLPAEGSFAQPARSPSACTAKTPAAIARKILVLDDEEAVARMIGDALVDYGFEVAWTTDPQKALKFLEQQHFDAILSDFKMPTMDGAEFYEKVRKHHPNLLEHIGFLTGDALSVKVRHFLDQSNCPVLEKPSSIKELVAFVDMLSKAKRMA